ncbi:MAG: RagB/SusD family nutrient uptake outer membrane protein [Bacteroidales bacterium]|jgi:hypothetical protein
MRKSALLFILLILFAACEDVFHEEETSVGKIDSYDELISATNGVYGKLAEAFNCSGGVGFYNPNIKGDDLLSNFPGYNNYYYNYNCLPTSGRPDLYYDHTGDNWKYLYSVIVSANNVIGQYTDTIGIDNKTKEILGESCLIRAYCYFRLTRTYGEIPLIDNIEIDYQAQKSSFPEIYRFIENDLKKAMDYLPANNDQARIPYVTPHRGVAKAMLAELYLSWAGYPVRDESKYELASLQAGQVIDSADFFGFGLVDDFAHLWDKDFYYNEESVLTLYFADPAYSSIIEEINFVYNGIILISSTHGNYDNPYYLEGILFRFYCTEKNFFNAYPKGYRKEITFYTTVYVPNNFYPEVDTGFITIDSVKKCGAFAFRKFYYEPSVVPTTQYYSYESSDLYLGNSKAYLFRYAHTLLTYAEATARSEQLNEKAYECVNMIRRRAHNAVLHTPSVYDLQPSLSPEVFADSVVWERAWELAGEPEGRWFDLVRLEMVEELPDLRDPDEGGFPEDAVTKEDYFSPVPAEDILLNPELGE